MRRARLNDGADLVDLYVEGGRVSAVERHSTEAPERVADVEIDAAGGLVRPPFVEPHIHLDA
ncbi:MAG: cytosine deaminase, partial [Actinomycetes bacterium]